MGCAATVGLSACSDKEDGTPGFAERFYNDFLAELLGDEPQKEVKTMPPLMNISVMNLQRVDVPLYATWFGQLRGTQQADIKPEVAGRIVSQDYIDGSPCEKGDPLFHIDDETYKAAYDMVANSIEQSVSHYCRDCSDVGSYVYRPDPKQKGGQLLR